MSLNHPIISVFWAPSSLLGHCHCSHCRHRAVVKDGGGREDLSVCPGNSSSARYVAEGARGGRKTHYGSSSGLSTCPCHVSVLASPRHHEVSCSVPAHPACTWTSFWAALPAGKPSCLTTRIKCSPSNTCASGWHGRGCQLAGQPFACDRWHIVSESSWPSLFSTPGTLFPTFRTAALIDLKPSGPALTCPVVDWIS